MNHSRSIGKLIIVALLAVLIAVPASLTVAPRKAQAVLPVVDFLNYAINGVTANAAGSLAVKEYALDNIAWVVAKVALQSVVKSTVNWINSGFNGSPAFVTDLSNNLQQVGDAAANQFISQYTSSLSINSPFKDAVGQAVLANYYLSTSRDGFFLQNPYTLNQVSPNDQAFLAGDFSQGGFAAWLNASLYPQNNPLGASELAKTALTGAVAGQQEQRKTELDWGRGFLSWRGDCNYSQNSQTGQITNLSYGSVDLNSTDKCISYSIETPGSVIEGQLQKVFGSSVDQLVTADELNEVVGALIGQLVNQVFGGGGLTGLSQQSAGGGGSYISQATSPTQYTQATNATNPSSAFLTTLGNEQTLIQQYKSNWQTILNAATAAKTACAAATSQADAVIAQANTAIANADSILNSLNQIKNTLIQTQASGSTAQASAISTATAEYQALLASPQMPTSDQISYAATQSVTSSDPSSPTLLDQMNQLASTAQCTP